MHEKIGTALCSFGMSGRVFHEPLLHVHSDYDLLAVLTRQQQLTFPAGRCYNLVHSLDDILNNSSIDLVVVNLPDQDHFRVSKACLEAGKNVVVEKPFTLLESEALDLTTIAEREHKLISVFHNRRWDSDFQTLRRVIESGTLGNIVEFEAHYDRFRPEPATNTWKEDGMKGSGILYTLGSHLIDQAVQLFGLPDEIWADVDTLRQGSRVDDYFQISMRRANLRITLKASYLVCKNGPKYLLHGDRGSYVKYGQDLQEEALTNGLLPDQPGFGEEPEDQWGRIYYPGQSDAQASPVAPAKSNYLHYFDQLSRALRYGEAPPVSAADATTVVRLIRMALLSATEKRTITVK